MEVWLAESMIHSPAFERGLKHLDAYIAVHAHARVPVKLVCEDGYPLGAWVRDVRTAYRKGKLSRERVAALEARGMDWGRSYDAAFLDGLRHLDEYRAAHGHSRVPRDFVSPDGYGLGKWIKTVRDAYRTSKLPLERVAALEERGMVWNALSQAFQTGLDQLDRYRAVFGHSRVPHYWVTEDSYRLGQWVNAVRTDYRSGKLNPDRIAALEERRMVWNPFDQAFQDGLHHLDEYRAAHGHANVPVRLVCPDGYPLGMWMFALRRAHRKGKLDPERIAALEERGMVWKPLGQAFQTGLDHLDAFRAVHGHARVPFDYVSDDGSRLGRWVHNVRVAHRRGKLDPERVAALEERGMVWNPQESVTSEASVSDRSASLV